MTRTDMMIGPLIEVLMETRHGKNEGDVDAFEDAIWNIVDRNDPKDIVHLCNAFDDDTPYADMTGPMQSLINGVHEYTNCNDTNDLVPHIVEGIVHMVPHAEEWATELLASYINHYDVFLAGIACYCADKPNHTHVLKHLLNKAYTSYGVEGQVDKLRKLLSV